MLSELSGTPLRPGTTWDAEAAGRLASFQRSEGLPSTGELDDVTATRLRARFEHAAEARRPDETAQVTNQSPTAEDHRRVVHLVTEALRAVEHVATQLGNDSPIRGAYVREAREYSTNIVRAFQQGEITAGEAALLASEMRNAAMKEARTGLSPAGAALSKYLKEEGLALPALFEKYSLRSHGKAFKELTAAERSAVCVKIAERAGVTNAKVNLASRLAPKLGKTLVAVTIAIAVYQVATAEDKVGEGIKQGAGFLGFLAGAKLGAVAGAAVCGPGAPACAVIGGIAGGVLGALAAEAAAEESYHRIKG
ncbi:MAG: hypothetical protein KF764_16820 [Labilithrix sp.]|nr:hypothetical protein [Labilithrix sp.]